MRDAFAAVQLVEALLDGGEEIDLVGDLVERGVVRKLLDDIEHCLFLCHGGIMPPRVAFGEGCVCAQ